MNSILSKFKQILIITSLLCGIPTVDVIIASCVTGFPSISQLFDKNSCRTNVQDLKFLVDDSRPASPCETSQIVAISSPVLVNSSDKHITILNLQIEIYSKKKYSTLTHNILFISESFHLSPLITELQI